MDFLGLLLCAIFTCILVHSLNSLLGWKKRSAIKYPPGPNGFPIIGNLFELGDKPHMSLAKLSQIHGPIMSLKLGCITTVVVSSPLMAKEVLQTHDISFSNRTVPDALRSYKHDEFGLPWMPMSSRWRSIRKICNLHMFSGKKLDGNHHLRRSKVQELLSEVQKCCEAGCAVAIGEVAFGTSLNFLSSTIFSMDLDSQPGSGSVQDFKTLVRHMTEAGGKPNLADYFPILRKIDPQGIRSRHKIFTGEMMQLFNQMIAVRLQLRKVPGYVTSNDMLDALLDISENNSEEIDTSRIEHLLLDLFVAGTDTTASTLEFSMAELLRNPETLMKARAELENTIGKGNPVQESDISRLPYLQAIVKETFRLHPTAPLLIPRKAPDADTAIAGFTVPKGAQVLVNAWAIGRDPSTWDNPISFEPERFLRSDIDVRGQNFELIPFGSGRRICPGLPLAIRMIHLMLGSLIHSFDWKLEDGVSTEDLNMEEKFGITLQMAHPLRAVPILR
ncbi:hypothetical protein F2P56_015312 [Juglans regia]|uniref:Geraniol 8-hydroxylase-like n=2 Tax=Juglans regia TaxID=51240 RepID=A0A833XET1_JUGRE|nr:geraniol 8-hydroxylase-like [Juglans regia]KAF5465292.1 hypothetical protein F2P56_015312 [Juglans regia]